ncbi:MAG: hypothetical protein HOV67_15625 [Kribbellaceae bacterium]|nr:hypothetical protein [Kribbellaceae bacterium]
MAVLPAPFGPRRPSTTPATADRAQAVLQDAYDVFSSPATTGALKVALFGEQGF